MERPWEDLGRLIKDKRIGLGLSQHTLATYVGKDATTVSRWEKGERRPKQTSILQLSNTLGIRIQVLQSMAGYTPEFDWYASFSAEADSEKDILLSASEEENKLLRRYLHYLRFSDQVRQSHMTK